MLTKVPYLVVISSPRTGSNFFFDMLSAQEGVLNLGELFNPNDPLVAPAVKARILAPFENIESFRERRLSNARSALSFLDDVPDANVAILKIQTHQLESLEGFSQVMRDAIGVVFLTRNVLAAWSSRTLVRHSRRWWGVSTEGATVEFSLESFVDHTLHRLERTEQLKVLARSLNKDTIHVEYSQLEALSTPQELWNHLRRQLPDLPESITKPNWKPRVVRQDSRSPIDRMSNREEALQILSRFRLERLATDEDAFEPAELIAALREMDKTRLPRRKPLDGA